MPACFVRAIEKVRDLLDSSKEETNVLDDEFIFIRDSTITRRLKLDQILYAEAMGDYVKLFTKEKFYAIHNTLRALEQRLPPSKFIDGKPVPVADAYRSKVNNRMNTFYGSTNVRRGSNTPP